MKIAVVYNRNSRNVINLFGMPNQERIGLATIKRLTEALRRGGHQVTAMEADKELISQLESFMPRVVQGERPGMVFNVSYGLQGQARYAHVPSILEMIGIPYVASGPLGHSLALDKVVTKMMLRQNDIPTPDFVRARQARGPLTGGPVLPMIVKPKNESVSFGLAVVHDENELRESAQVIFDRFHQPVLAEQYIEGREINVGLLGNAPPEPFPPVMLSFGADGPQIYTYEDKTGRSGRTIEPLCPAPVSEELAAQAQDIAVRSFSVLGLHDCARVGHADGRRRQPLRARGEQPAEPGRARVVPGGSSPCGHGLHRLRQPSRRGGQRPLLRHPSAAAGRRPGRGPVRARLPVHHPAPG